jgi:hypothetical protein
MSRLISDEYRLLLQEMHRTQRWGYGGGQYAQEIRLLAKRLRARTVLDYGSGGGSFVRHPAIRHRFRVFEYDPGISFKSGMPRPTDLVVTTDVMEHVEPKCLDEVLRHLYSLAQIACYNVIATRPAHKYLPDGRNAHLIIESAEWWEQRFKKLSWDVAMKARSEGEVRILAVKKRSALGLAQVLLSKM